MKSKGRQTRALRNTTLNAAFAGSGSVKITELLPIGQIRSEPVVGSTFSTILSQHRQSDFMVNGIECYLEIKEYTQVYYVADQMF